MRPVGAKSTEGPMVGHLRPGEENQVKTQCGQPVENRYRARNGDGESHRVFRYLRKISPAENPAIMRKNRVSSF